MRGTQAARSSQRLRRDGRRGSLCMSLARARRTVMRVPRCTGRAAASNGTPMPMVAWMSTAQGDMASNAGLLSGKLTMSAARRAIPLAAQAPNGTAMARASRA